MDRGGGFQGRLGKGSYDSYVHRRFGNRGSTYYCNFRYNGLCLVVLTGVVNIFKTARDI